MANVLKKLLALVPTIEDTVGNFETAPATNPPSSTVLSATAPTPQIVAQAEVSLPAYEASAEGVGASNEADGSNTPKHKAAKPKPRSNAG